MTNSKSGFTLLETLVAITVLVIATVGPMTLAAQSTRNASLFRNQTIAYFLAEEAVEYVHNAIDANSFQGAGWLTNLDDCLAPNSCYIDVPLNVIVSSCSGTCPFIRFEEADGVYGYFLGGDTLFIRTVSIDVLVPDQEIRVNADVAWDQTGRNHNVSISAHIFNWR